MSNCLFEAALQAIEASCNCTPKYYVDISDGFEACEGKSKKCMNNFLARIGDKRYVNDDGIMKVRIIDTYVPVKQRYGYIEGLGTSKVWVHQRYGCIKGMGTSKVWVHWRYGYIKGMGTSKVWVHLWLSPLLLTKTFGDVLKLKNHVTFQFILHMSVLYLWVYSTAGILDSLEYR